MGRYKKRGQDTIINRGLDYIKAEIEIKEKSSLISLNYNSNFFEFEYKKNKLLIQLLPGLEDYYSHYGVIQIKGDSNNINACFFGFGAKTQTYTKEKVIKTTDELGEIQEEIEYETIDNGRRKEFVEISGQGLIFLQIKDRLKIFDKFKIEIKRFIRCDVFLDLDIEINYFYEKILNTDYKKRVKKLYKSKKHNIETIYFNEKSSKKNDYKFIRIYNKILDSNIKNKWKYYESMGYNKYENITRFEIENRSELAKFWKVEDLTDDNFLFSIIVGNFYKMNVQFFKFFDFENFVVNNKIRERKKEEIQEKLKQNLLYQGFSNYGGSFNGNYTPEQGLSAFYGYYRKLRTIYKADELMALISQYEQNNFDDPNKIIHKEL